MATFSAFGEVEIHSFLVAELLVRHRGSFLRARIDLTDLPEVLSVSTRWRATWDKDSKTYYVRSSTDKLLHRVITDAPVGMTVDHWDHDGLNNCRSNLRVVTQSVNSQNCRWKLGKSGLRGVTLRPSGKYRASVMRNWKRVLLGDYPTANEAAAAVQNFLTGGKSHAS